MVGGSSGRTESQTESQASRVKATDPTRACLFFRGRFSEPRSVAQKQKLILQSNQSQSVCLCVFILGYFFINLLFLHFLIYSFLFTFNSQPSFLEHNSL